MRDLLCDPYVCMHHCGFLVGIIVDFLKLFLNFVCGVNKNFVNFSKLCGEETREEEKRRQERGEGRRE